MDRHLIPLFICLALLGCTDLGMEPEPAREPIETMVHFTDGTTLEQAEQLIRELGLTFEVFTTGTPLGAAVTVPIGTEDVWVAKFGTYPIVRYAGRVWLVHWTG